MFTPIWGLSRSICLLLILSVKFSELLYLILKPLSMSYFRPLFSNFMRFDPYWGVFFILLIGIPRFIIVLGANVSGNYNFTSLIFILMWILPYALLNREGRKQIGIRKTKKSGTLLFSFLLGLGICIPVFLLGIGLYGDTTDNWFVYISRSYSGGLPADLSEARFLYFIIFSVISMIFKYRRTNCR